MPQIACYDEVKAQRKQREIPGGYAWRTNFLVASQGETDAPMAFLAERSPGRVIRPHFHDVDQFQVIVSGGGVLGKHGLAIHAVHFSRAHTPYGPIVASEQGVGFLTLRPQWDPGAQYLDDAGDKLRNLPNRKPWQVTELPQFCVVDEVNVHEFSSIKDDRGLAAFSISLKPHARTRAPDPSRAAGQYVIITRGGLIYQGAEHKAITIAYLKPDEQALELVAGAQGLEALVLHFPQCVAPAARAPVAAKSAGYRVWQCALCSFTYDEAEGLPHEGIAAGTRWEDVPETWSCPDCSASKSDFEMSVVG
jgi:rubredoxin